jgi:PAS domain S-box-containing protein
MMMAKIQEIEEKTEPHRKAIGWTSIIIGIIIFCALSVYITVIEHDNAQSERVLQREFLRQSVLKQKHLTKLEDAIRDMVGASNRCIVIYHAGSRQPGDGSVIHWPPAAEKLLGWTWEDVRAGGLELMIQPIDREKHHIKMERFIDIPIDQRKTSILYHDAIHKDGHLVPVIVSVWCVGDHTRSLAATIDAQDKVVEIR